MGLFITFEGLDGSGKTTQVRLLYEKLTNRGAPVLLTREPGGTAVGEQIRDILHSVANITIRPRTETLLFSASRAQLVEEVIGPALAENKIVLCDRYFDSTLAYQGYGHGLDLTTLRSVTEFATTGLRPDLTVYLDIDVQTALARRHAAHEQEAAELNRMDRQAIDFFNRVRQGYLEMIAAEPERWLVIDATKPGAEVHAAVCQKILPIVEQWMAAVLK